MTATAASSVARPTGADALPGKASRGVQSVDVCGKLLGVLAHRAPVALAELAAAADVPAAQVHTYLVSLARLGLVKRDALLGEYEPGPLALRLALLHLNTRTAYRAAVPEVIALARQSALSIAITLAGPHGPTIVRYEHAASPLHVNLHVGSVLSLTATSTGRVFCAFGQRDRLETMQPGYDAMHGNARETRAFSKRIENIRRRGIERSIDAPTPSVSSMSVPVIDAAGELHLTLTAIGPTDVLDVAWEGSVARELVAAAKRIESRLGKPTDALDTAHRPGAAAPMPAPTPTPDDTPPDETGQRGIRTLDTTGSLLNALVAAGRPLILRDLAAAAGMSAAKAFPHLVSLTGIGLVSRDEAGAFTSGSLGLELGLMALQRQSPVRDAEADIARLAASTGLTVAASVLGPLGPTIVRLEESAQPVHVSLRVGTVMSLVGTAIGRVFAAHSPADLRSELLAFESLRLAGMGKSPALGTAYEMHLEAIRKHGIDSACGVPIPGIDALAAPVFDHSNAVCLVIALIGSTGSFDASIGGGAARQLLAATRRLSRSFGWAPEDAVRSMQSAV